MSEPTYEFITTETRGRVFTVTINRPKVMNSLHPPANAEMGAAMDHFAENNDLWVAIITGAGERAFSAGNDLKFTAEGGGKLEIPKHGFGGLTSRFDMWKPVIAAVNGVALGGGFEIALACDMIIAADSARFGLPEPRVGLAALAGGMQRLPRQIGMKNAMHMMLTAGMVDAAEAFRLGIAQEVVPADKLMERANALADSITECAPLSVRTTKQVAILSQDLGLEESMSGKHYSTMHELFHSEDFKEGPRAFVEKRKPNWQGK
jgi:enoyl-CoA hydratase/carnithine racemase